MKHIAKIPKLLRAKIVDACDRVEAVLMAAPSTDTDCVVDSGLDCNNKGVMVLATEVLLSPVFDAAAPLTELYVDGGAVADSELDCTGMPLVMDCPFPPALESTSPLVDPGMGGGMVLDGALDCDNTRLVLLDVKALFPEVVEVAAPPMPLQMYPPRFGPAIAVLELYSSKLPLGARL